METQSAIPKPGVLQMAISKLATFALITSLSRLEKQIPVGTPAAEAYYKLIYELSTQLTKDLTPNDPRVITNFTEEEKKFIFVHNNADYSAKIRMIKMVRERSGCGLAEAKLACEKYARENGGVWY
jgi:ribosomal protein L7/L12